mmetsp:Transcript_22902/g.48363  ORF Transcript_22902/g.48363 Transcript_22902/m.48363 type:complete len:263 (-) Transcript_22902:1385-2173(-)
MTSMPLSIEVDSVSGNLLLDVGNFFIADSAFSLAAGAISLPCSVSSNKSSMATSSNPITSPRSSDNALLAKPIFAAQDAAPLLTSASGWMRRSSSVPSSTNADRSGRELSTEEAADTISEAMDIARGSLDEMRSLSSDTPFPLDHPHLRAHVPTSGFPIRRDAVSWPRFIVCNNFFGNLPSSSSSVVFSSLSTSSFSSSSPSNSSIVSLCNSLFRLLFPSLSLPTFQSAHPKADATNFLTSSPSSRFETNLPICNPTSLLNR